MFYVFHIILILLSFSTWNKKSIISSSAHVDRGISCKCDNGAKCTSQILKRLCVCKSKRAAERCHHSHVLGPGLNLNRHTLHFVNEIVVTFLSFMTLACRYLPILKRQNLSYDVKYQCSVAKVKEKNVNHQGHSLYIQERCCQVRYNAWKKASERIDINFPHYCHMLSISNIDHRDHNHCTKVPNSERRRVQNSKNCLHLSLEGSTTNITTKYF